MAKIPPLKKAIEVTTAPDKPFKGLEVANDNAPPGGIDAETLLGLDFPPVSYVVDGYIAEGLTILAGRPKLGKSWLALGFCIAVATGGTVLGADCEEGDVVYLALEDNRRRLKERLQVVLTPPQVRPDMSRLTLHTESPKIGAGLVEMIEDWRNSVSNPKLIVIDTLSMVRPPKKSNQDSYAADYDAISPLQKYAGEHGLAIVVVHHVRKAEAEDPLEAVSGTNGLTGAADTIMVLNRTADGPNLYGRGRDIEEVEKALRFDKGVWQVLGDADDVRRSDQRRKIMEVLTDATLALTPTDISKEAGMKEANVKYLLRAMVKAGEIEKVGYGQYKLAGR
jgi:RecA-family ATPase